MAEQTKEYASTLNDLIAVCKDAEQGFRGAADAVEDPHLKNVFRQYSSQRAEFVTELQAEVRRLGESADDPSGVAGKLHSGWIGLKAALTGHDARHVLEETERGEDYSVKHYREALSKGLPAGVRTVIESQFDLVQEAHDNVKAMRDASVKGEKTPVQSSR
jgi:uncharacterized protein (TIGR02284 family)